MLKDTITGVFLQLLTISLLFPPPPQLFLLIALLCSVPQVIQDAFLSRMHVGYYSSGMLSPAAGLTPWRQGAKPWLSSYQTWRRK